MEGCRSSLICLIIIAFLAYGRGQLVGRSICRSSQELPCDNTQCIQRDQWCDKNAHCADGSDEMHCKTARWYESTPDNRCTEKHFRCSNEICVPASARCDEFDDCGDFSDEDECENATPEVTQENEDVTGSYSHFTTDAYEEPLITTAITPRRDTRTSISPPPVYDYSRRASESDDHLRQRPDEDRVTGYYPPHYYGQNQNKNYGRGHPDPYHQTRASDTPPDRSFPRYPPITSYPPTTTTPRPRYPLPVYREDPPRRSRQPYGERHRQMIIPSRSVLYPPPQRPSYSRRSKILNLVLPPFYFSKNYTSQLGYNYLRHVEKAKAWLLSQRDSSYAWGTDTPRGLIALSLITNSFTSDVTDNVLMQKSLQTHLGIKILRNNTGAEHMSTTRLAMYINALLATCQDPRDFLGLDLADILYQRKNSLERFQRFVNPLVYLSLCLTNVSVSRSDLHSLTGLLSSRFSNDVSKDIHILTTTALACFSQQQAGNRHFRAMVDEAARNLVSQAKLSDNSFGSIYSTALAAQALMSANSAAPWDPKLTLDYLARNQSEDGSFGDMQATYYAVIALSGRSLVHLRNTQCDPITVNETLSPEDILNPPGNPPRKSIFFSLRVGYPETFSISLQLTIPVYTNFFDAMRVAAYLDPRYRFSYKITSGLLGVHTIANVPNDAERGLYWNLYHLRTSDRSVDLSRRFTGDIRELIPEDSDELLYWYLPYKY